MYNFDSFYVFKVFIVKIIWTMQIYKILKVIWNFVL